MKSERKTDKRGHQIFSEADKERGFRRYLNGMGYAAIARELKCSEDTVRTWAKIRRWKDRREELEIEIEGKTEGLVVDAGTAKDQAKLQQVQAYRALLAQCRRTIEGCVTIEEVSGVATVFQEILRLGEVIHGKDGSARPTIPIPGSISKPKQSPAAQQEPAFDPDHAVRKVLTDSNSTVQSSSVQAEQPKNIQSPHQGSAGGGRPQRRPPASQGNSTDQIRIADQRKGTDQLQEQAAPGQGSPLTRWEGTAPTSGVDTELSEDELKLRSLPPGHPSRQRRGI